MSELILHNYTFSSFAKKARLMMGHKGLTWRAVDQPMIMPKPLLLPLTGGYRRIPVLQVGADVYCDTRCIADELERRHPAPSLFPAGTHGMCEGLGIWADNFLVFCCARYATGLKTDSLPEEFYADRSVMWGLPPSVNRAAGVVTRYHEQLIAQLAWLEPWCAGADQFLLGPALSLADLSVYHGLWFLGANGDDVAAVLEPYPAIRAWMARVTAVGEGQCTPLDGEEALAIARKAEPAPLPVADEAPPDPSEFRLGDAVTVTPTDYARDPVAGELVGLSPTRITVRREHPAVGAVHVHFPRLNYRLRAA